MGHTMDINLFFSRFCSGTPHDVMKRFVEYNTTVDIWHSYNDLYDLCHNSRYKNHQIDQRELEVAGESLETIKVYCADNLR